MDTGKVPAAITTGWFPELRRATYAGSDKDSRHPILRKILDLIEIIDSLSFDSLSSMVRRG